MAASEMTPQQLQDAIDAVARADGNKSAAARALGISRNALAYRHDEAVRQGYVPYREDSFEIEDLPDEVAPVEEIIDRRLKEYERYSRAQEARKLIQVKVKVGGPIGIVHFGDPHVDDKGCDLQLLLRHCEIIKKTDGLLGANVGDTTNNWVGRLGNLYGEQSATKAEAWRLAEHFLKQNLAEVTVARAMSARETSSGYSS